MREVSVKRGFSWTDHEFMTVVKINCSRPTGLVEAGRWQANRGGLKASWKSGQTLAKADGAMKSLISLRRAKYVRVKSHAAA
jgi:hypothetical protein